MNWKFRRAWYLMRSVGVLILAVASLGLCLMLDCAGTLWEVVGRVLLSLDLIVLAWMVVAANGKVMRNKWMFLTFFLVIIAMGVCVYGTIGGPEMFGGDELSRFFYPIVNTLSVFFPSRGDYDPEYVKEAGVWYYLLHFFGYFFAAWLLFAMFGKKMINRTLSMVISSRNKNVFWGYSMSGVALAKDMMRGECFRQPVFVLSHKSEYDEAEESKIYDELMDFGAIVLHEDFNKDLKEKGVRHFFMSENQDENVRLALKIIKQLKQRASKLEGKTYLHVRTEIEGIDALFEGRLGEELKGKVEINIFSQSDLAARLFVREHPVLDLVGREFKPEEKRLKVDAESVTVSGECKILLLGLGWSGYELLRKMVCDAQFLGDDFHFSVTVIDEEFADNHGRYMRLFETARRLGVEINVNPTIFVDKGGVIVGENRSGLMGDMFNEECEKINVCSVNSCYFYRWLSFRRNVLDFDRIVVTLGNDELNTNTAMQLHRFRLSFLDARNAADDKYMPEKIFVHIKDYHSYQFYREERSPIVPFGNLEDINTVDNLIREIMDDVAKQVNYVYSMNMYPQLTVEQLSDHSAIEAEWDKNDTNIFNQNSSRSVALNVRNTVTVAGGIDKFRERVYDPYYLEKYAEMEHKRWNAYNIMCGVDVWDKDEVTAKNGKLRFGGTLVRHICLVGFDELDEMSLKVRNLGNTGKNYKETDRRIVRHFPVFYDIMESKKK